MQQEKKSVSFYDYDSKGIPVSSESPRVRFAPAPTGTMHIGNIRTALLNYLFAKQRNGTFILRIEDTDADRNFDPGAKQIMRDLAWMSLSFDEGPEHGGPYAPYFQSERMAIYQEKLNELITKKLAYRCFCTEEELDKKRTRQQALKMPPRYDRTCLALSPDAIQKLMKENVPSIWRFQLDHELVTTITDLAHGNVTFQLKNFSDFALTRTDGSFTFLFANFVDDLTMKMTHVFRGEDHLSNTANQAAMYHAFDTKLPIFWHMPILCSIDGKKLSKRDFGFSLNDLKKAGFLPEAINNYLAIIGSSFEQEIMTLEELSRAFKFDSMHTTGKIKYDVEKLRWVNHQWIKKLAPAELAARCKPFLIEAYPQAASLITEHISRLLEIIKTDLYTLADATQALAFYFTKPELTVQAVHECIPAGQVKPLSALLARHHDKLDALDTFLAAVKNDAQQEKMPLKNVFWVLRLGLMNAINGPSIHDLVAILGQPESKTRIIALLEFLARIE